MSAEHEKDELALTIGAEPAPTALAAPVPEQSRVLALFERAFEAGGATPEALQKLLELKEQMDRRAAERAFGEAFAEFQRRCPRVEKRSNVKMRTRGGSELKMRYADLEDIERTAGPVLRELGLSFGFDTEVSAGTLTVTCTLRHRDGHHTESRFTMPLDSDAPMSNQHKASAANKFAKRLALINALGLVDTDDSDPGDAPDRVTDEQAANLSALLDETRSDRAAFLAWADASSVEDVQASRYASAVAMLERKRRQR